MRYPVVHEIWFQVEILKKLVMKQFRAVINGLFDLFEKSMIIILYHCNNYNNINYRNKNLIFRWVFAQSLAFQKRAVFKIPIMGFGGYRKI